MQPNQLYSWNINGLKAILRKNFSEFLQNHDPDVLCLQETKAQNDEVQELLAPFNAYHIFSNSAEQKGYAGTAVLSKTEPLHVQYGTGHDIHDKEGRTIALEYEDYWLVNVYVPNAGSGLKRLEYREQWDRDFREYLKNLGQQKPVIVTGDFNVAHEEIDIARPKQNYNKSAGFTQTEIDGFEEHLSKGWIDAFRKLYPEKVVYSYWTYRANARERNVGWRIDYFLVSEKLWNQVQDASMLTEVYGSDHCPLLLKLD